MASYFFLPVGFDGPKARIPVITPLDDLSACHQANGLHRVMAADSWTGRAEDLILKTVRGTKARENVSSRVLIRASRLLHAGEN